MSALCHASLATAVAQSTRFDGTELIKRTTKILTLQEDIFVSNGTLERKVLVAFLQKKVTQKRLSCFSRTDVHEIFKSPLMCTCVCIMHRLRIQMHI